MPLKYNSNSLNKKTSPFKPGCDAGGWFHSAANNIYLNGVRIAGVLPDGTARFYLTDQVDSVSLVTDDNGRPMTDRGLAVAAEGRKCRGAKAGRPKLFEYLPYGYGRIPVQDSADRSFTRCRIARSGQLIAEGDEKHQPKYDRGVQSDRRNDEEVSAMPKGKPTNSQELDAESRFYFYNARHYDPEIARFVTADTVVDGEFTVTGWNRYMYVGGNSVMYKDPSGNRKGYRDTRHENVIKNRTFQGLSNQKTARPPSSAGSALGEAMQMTNDLVDFVLINDLASQKKYRTVQYSTDVVIESIERLQVKRLKEYKKTGNAKVLNISAQDIQDEAMSYKVPDAMFLKPGGFGAGRFEYGKTLKETFDRKRYTSEEIAFSEEHVKKLADSFTKGPKALKKYYPYSQESCPL